MTIWWFVCATLVLITTLTVSIAVVFWIHGKLEFAKSYENIETVKMHPVFTYLDYLIQGSRAKHPRAFILRVIGAICKVYERHKIVNIWVGFKPFVFIMKPDAVEALLNSSRTISKAEEYHFMEPWLGTGLLTSTGDKWRSRRKLLTPAFHFQILQNFLLSFNEDAAVLTRKLESEVGKPWIDIVPMIAMCTLDAICQTAMGVHLNVQSGCCKDYLEKTEEISDAIVYRAFRQWIWPDLIFLYCSSTGRRFRKNVESVQDFTRKVIKEKKESLLKQISEGNVQDTLSGSPKKKAFLELLLDAHLKDSSFTEGHIREEVDTFMFEGHETTAMSVSWTLYLLGLNPEIQEKVFQELDSIFRYDKERGITAEDLKEMKYLECTIKESMRLYPSVSFIGRKLTENLKIDNDTLTPGCTCVVFIFMLHKDPEQFPEPEVFDPDRFLPENSSKRHPYAFIPFSAGPRNCIGQKFALMEVKTVLAYILRKFRVTSLDPRDRVETMLGLTLKNAEPVRINIALRETKD